MQLYFVPAESGQAPPLVNFGFVGKGDFLNAELANVFHYFRCSSRPNSRQLKIVNERGMLISPR